MKTPYIVYKNQEKPSKHIHKENQRRRNNLRKLRTMKKKMLRTTNMQGNVYIAVVGWQ